MARLIANITEVDTMCRERQTQEQQLAQKLYFAFNQGTALKNIQAVGARLVTEMLDTNDPELQKALGDNKTLDIFKHFSDLPDVLKRANALTPDDIDDLMWLCSTWVFHGGGTRQSYWPTKEVHGAYKVGVTQTKAPRDKPGGMAQHADDAKKAVWSEEKGARFRGPWTAGIESHIKPHLGSVTSPGMSMKRSQEGSTVLKVDRLFGLLCGADISGSTAEDVAMLERWGSNLHSAYYLLPLATMVYNGHHTIFEAALTLSLNKIIDYHIGFYTSLLPDGAPQELNLIIDALKEAEERAEHFVVFFNTMGQTAGCLLFDQHSEKNLLREGKFGRATKMLKRAQTLSSFPTAMDVFKLIKDTTPGLAPEDLRTKMETL